jgi:hypothetical protein
MSTLPLPHCEQRSRSRQSGTVVAARRVARPLQLAPDDPPHARGAMRALLSRLTISSVALFIGAIGTAAALSAVRLPEVRQFQRCPRSEFSRIKDVGAYEVAKFCKVFISVWENIVVTNDAGEQQSGFAVSDLRKRLISKPRSICGIVKVHARSGSDSSKRPTTSGGLIERCYAFGEAVARIVTGLGPRGLCRTLPVDP